MTPAAECAPNSENLPPSLSYDGFWERDEINHFKFGNFHLYFYQTEGINSRPDSAELQYLASENKPLYDELMAFFEDKGENALDALEDSEKRRHQLYEAYLIMRVAVDYNDKKLFK